MQSNRWRATLLLACLVAAASGAEGRPRQKLLQVPAGDPPGTQAPPPLPELGAAPDSPCCEQLAELAFSSNLPVVVLNTGGQKLEDKGLKAPGRLCTCSPQGLGYQDYDGLAEAQVRGSTSATLNKKSFDVELQQPGNNGTKKLNWPVLGMPADNDWVLYGDGEVDLTLGMRNYVGYTLGLASGQYAPRSVWVELFLVDGGPDAPSMAHYHGLYLLLEKRKVAPARVAVAKLEPPNLSGGYLFAYENDNVEGGDVTFGPLRGWDHPFLMKDPKSAPPEALAWLTDYLQAFQDALEAADWLSRQPSYTTYIDGPSWTNYFLLTELTKNPDGYRGSTYLHKDRDKPVAAGPIWDLNEAFGLCCGYPIEGWNKDGISGPGQSGGSAISAEGWRFNICADPARCLIDPSDGISRWYRRMWQDPRFVTAAATRFAELRAGPWSDAAVGKLIKDAAAQVEPAALRDYQRWGSITVKPWYGDGETQWSTEVSRMGNWLNRHLSWMDTAFAQARDAASAGGSPAGRR